ncbi:hypothetical protein ACVWYF_002944 [Hymenobacter sp. UYAg731]
MKKVQLTNRAALIARIMTQKALAPAGSVHCVGHCLAGM